MVELFKMAKGYISHSVAIILHASLENVIIKYTLCLIASNYAHTITLHRQARSKGFVYSEAFTVRKLMKSHFAIIHLQKSRSVILLNYLKAISIDLLSMLNFMRVYANIFHSIRGLAYWEKFALKASLCRNPLLFCLYEIYVYCNNELILEFLMNWR